MPIHAGVELIGEAPAFVALVKQAAVVAGIDAPVLIDGETGTGKELIARSMHYRGARSGKPFIPVNCGALPESLIENEFFGHGRGAFTDARESYAGLIAQAQGGTLFLDEIDALPLRGQVALLRFLQDFRYRPLGTGREERAQVRIMAATNNDLDRLVAMRQFRPDLLQRVRIFRLTVPPLRERPGDAVLLVRHFARLYSRQYGLAEPTLRDEDIGRIEEYDWPGNVRELENTVHRWVVLHHANGSAGFELTMQSHGDREFSRATPAESWALQNGFRRSKAAVVNEFERAFIEQALLECQGNVSAAARLSGKERRAFGRLVKKHGLDKREQH